MLRIQHWKEIVKWVINGKPIPPPHIIKQKIIRTYAKTFKINILVETGTYRGDMVDAMKYVFDYIYSIELSKKLYKKAKDRFKGEEHIELICGDSGIELLNVINRINQPTLFWLDGHYSEGITARADKDTPIHEELDHLLNAENLGHVIIIDDARNFGSHPAYPSIYELKNLIWLKKPNVNIVIKDDVIRITPN